MSSSTTRPLHTTLPTSNELEPDLPADHSTEVHQPTRIDEKPPHQYSPPKPTNDGYGEILWIAFPSRRYGAIARICDGEFEEFLASTWPHDRAKRCLNNWDTLGSLRKTLWVWLCSTDVDNSSPGYRAVQMCENELRKEGQSFTISPDRRSRTLQLDLFVGKHFYISPSPGMCGRVQLEWWDRKDENQAELRFRHGRTVHLREVSLSHDLDQELMDSGIYLPVGCDLTGDYAYKSACSCREADNGQN